MYNAYVKINQHYFCWKFVQMLMILADCSKMIEN